MDAEVQNGGHLQYFENGPGELVPHTIRALVVLDAPKQAGLLEHAFERWTDRERARLTSAEKYTDEALKAEFGDLDGAYYESSPGIAEILARYLDADQTSFIELV